MSHWGDSHVVDDGVRYRRSRAGRWYYLHRELSWCPVFDKKRAARLDELEQAR